MATHLATVWRYLRVLGADAALADDLCQEVFLQVWRRPFETRDAATTAAYLRTAARHRFIDWRRRERRSQPLSVFDDDATLDSLDAAWTAWVPDGASSDTRLLALHDCLAILPPNEATAVRLRFADRRSGREIARHLNLKTDTAAWSLLKRARRRLRTCVTEKLDSST